jgi:hypothetical protein
MSRVLHGPSQSTRVKTIVFLLTQRVQSALSTPWAEYERYLPEDVHVPTMWHDYEVALLGGTSLEVSSAGPGHAPGTHLCCQRQL